MNKTGIDFKELLNRPEYDFLRTNEHLGDNVCLLTLGGSYAYGTNVEGSDIDIRGIAVPTKREVLLGKGFEQVLDSATDTTIYSFNKIIQLLSNCNPNTIELLGFPKNEYICLSPVGILLWNNRHIFLSKRCIHTFGGYAINQLRRLQNKAARRLDQPENEKYILESIKNAEYDFKTRYFPTGEGTIKLYTDQAVNPEYESEIFMDVNLKKYPLRDYIGMWNEMKSIVSSYSKNSKRNEAAIEKGKLGKHMMHLIRLYMMCIDILEKEKIITRREAEHDLLMDIRNGKYLDGNSQPTSDFYELLNEYEKRFNYAKNNTSLPDKPDYKKIENLQFFINDSIAKEVKWINTQFPCDQ